MSNALGIPRFLLFSFLILAMKKRIVKNILIRKTPHYAIPMLCGALYLFFNLFLYFTLKFSPSGTIKFAGTVTIGKSASESSSSTYMLAGGFMLIYAMLNIYIPNP